MTDKEYSRADIKIIADKIYTQAGRKKHLLQRIRNYKTVAQYPRPIHNYYYVDKEVYDYSDLNATLSRAVVFLDGQGESALDAGKDFVELLCCLADTRYLIDYTFCDKAFDGYAMQLLLHAWLQVKTSSAFTQICAKAEQEIIEDWFYERARLMYRDRDAQTWSTFRPYDNQEIGVGACVLLARMFGERDPELAKGLYDLADSRVVGWEKKNGNLDDTLFYTPIFAKVLYFYALYRPKPEWLTLDNCRQTFEGVLQQQPGNGIYTLYNWTQYGSAAEMMALGARLFGDGRYKWMANRFLQERLEKRNSRMQYAARDITEERLDTELEGEANAELCQVIKEELKHKERYDHVWEGVTDNIFHLWLFWDDEIKPIQPHQGSMLLEKSAGQGRWPYDPEPLLPDKIVLREGWEGNDMFALLNLWGGQNSPSARTVSHRYPASNEIISLVCGEQFLVQNIDQVTRDIFIKRSELNAFNLKRNGNWISAPLQEHNTPGSYPALMQYNAEVRFFESFQEVDGSKSTMYEYYGWTNERTCLMCKGRYLVVFDQSFGTVEETGGVRWHLQGEVIDHTHHSIRMQLLDSQLDVMYPHGQDWFEVEKAPNRRMIPVYQHHADLDLDLVSTGTRMGFVTIFCPVRGAAPTAIVADVTCSGHPAHPNAIGLHIGSDLIGTRLGMYRDEYSYDEFKTDAAAFVLSKRDEGYMLTVFDARSVRFPIDSYVGMQTNSLQNTNISTDYNHGILTLHFSASVSGTFFIKIL